LFMASALRKSGKLLEKVADYNMVMTLPKNIPTLEAKLTKNWTHPNNGFCSENMADLIVICDTDPRLRGPGTDRVPILTTVELPARHTVIPPTYNFRMEDLEEFNKELEARLVDIPPPATLATEPQFQAAVHHITEMLRDIIHTTVTLAKPSPHSKHWWNKDLSNLKKKKNKLSSLLYKYRAIRDHPIHKEHRQIRNKYLEAILLTKQEHWNNFLEDISNSDIWIAN
jgi:hypothetical protein